MVGFTELIKHNYFMFELPRFVLWVRLLTSKFRNKTWGISERRVTFVFQLYFSWREREEKQAANMDAIKKKMQAMKMEKDSAMDKADTCEAQAKDANLKADKVITTTWTFS